MIEERVQKVRKSWWHHLWTASMCSNSKTVTIIQSRTTRDRELPRGRKGGSKQGFMDWIWPDLPSVGYILKKRQIFRSNQIFVAFSENLKFFATLVRKEIEIRCKSETYGMEWTLSLTPTKKKLLCMYVTLRFQFWQKIRCVDQKVC